MRDAAALVCRVRKVVPPVQARDGAYNGRLPAPVPDGLLRTARDDIWAHVPREAHASFRAIRAVLASAGHAVHTPAQVDTSAGRSAHTVYVHFFDAADASEHLEVTYRWSAAGALRERFPVGTRGFFYLHIADASRPIGAQLRFRTVSGPDPASFAAGRDPKLPSGQPWAINVGSMLQQEGLWSARNVLRRMLLDQGLIGKDVLHERWDSGSIPSPNVIVAVISPHYLWII
jgi:hypothetical protein